MNVSEPKPAWYEIAKKGSIASTPFDEELKRSVLSNINRREKRYLQSVKQVLAAIVVCMALGLSLLLVTNEGVLFKKSEQAASPPAGTPFHSISGIDTKEHPFAYKLLDARITGNGSIISMNDPDILPGLGNKVNPLHAYDNRMIYKISYTDIEVLSKKDMDGFGTLLKYKAIKDDPKLPYFRKGDEHFGYTVDGLTGPEVIYDFGTANLYDAQMAVTRVFGHQALKIWLVCGADGIRVCTYYNREQNGGMASYLEFDNATMYERDLNGDGLEEAIAVSNTTGQIYIFKENAEQLYWVSVREALGAGEQDVVSYEKASGMFTLLKQDIALRKYRYTENADKFVLVE